MMRLQQPRPTAPGILAGFFVACAVALATPAAASHLETLGRCQVRAGVLATFLSDNPSSRLLGYHRGDAGAAAVKKYNAIPRPTDLVATEVLVYGRPDRDRVVVILFHGGCLVTWSAIPPDVWFDVPRESLDGDDA